MLRTFPAEERYCLSDQISRSCLSIILNIAEGSAKKSDRDFKRFLQIAIASLNEVVAGFDCAYTDDIITQQQQSNLEKRADSLAKQIGSFIRILNKKANKPMSQFANC